jgi:hypothetical protein
MRHGRRVNSRAILWGVLGLWVVGCGASRDEPALSVTEPSVEKTDDAQPTQDVGPVDVPVERVDPKSPEPEDNRPRLGALGPHTWIWKKPEATGLAIGKLRIGTSVPLVSTEGIQGPGCKGKFYRIEPRGYVCVGAAATLNLDDPFYKALAFSAPEPGIWPYRYAHSDGAPMYSRVPKPEEWAREAGEFGPINTPKSLGKWAVGHEELIVDEKIAATDEVPYFLKDGKRTAPGGNFNIDVLRWRTIPPGSMLAYSRAFEMYGRVWLLTPDTMIVPADRVSTMKRSVFEGVHFDRSEARLPFAWNRAKSPLPMYMRNASGEFIALSETWKEKTYVEITGDESRGGSMVFYELRKRPGVFVGVTVARAASKLPNGIKEGEKWIEVKIVPGTLTAYVGLDPVFSTMFSPGKGGPPVPGHDHEKYATTATGFFPIEWKERVATMSNENGVPKVLWFTDVPHQQYLKAPLAMHVTFWHEDFGKRKSAECVNVSPIDGNFLFGWTEPKMPQGWNAVGAGQGNGKSTPVVVTAN